MSKFDLIVADPPWMFEDSLSMSEIKRGAEANYSVLNIEAIKQLKVNEITADNAVLALWVPSSLLQDGLDTMKTWGFRQTQTHIWVKIKNDPFHQLTVNFIQQVKMKFRNGVSSPGSLGNLFQEIISKLSLDDILAFGMGRLFRQTHEICLLGVKGKAYETLNNKAQRSVHFDSNKKHSAKPEILQDRLEKMYPKATKLEMFARRSRKNWTCVGLECPDTIGEDIRDSLDRLSKLS